MLLGNKGRPSSQYCGGCKACCVVMGVTELGKQTYTECAHLCQTGCVIYNSRPPSCSGFQCFYTLGTIKSGQGRPDQLGLILYPAKNDRIGDVVMAWEVWEDAAEGEAARSLLDVIRLATPVFVMQYKGAGRSLIGPPQIMPEIVKALAGRSNVDLQAGEIEKIELPTGNNKEESK